MSRTICEIISSNNKENEKRIISILTTNGYKRKVKNNEVYYKKGNSILSASKCIKYTISNNQIIFEAWVNNSGLVESSLDGFIGFLPKKQCKKTLDLIIDSMESDSSSIQSNLVDNEKINNPKNIESNDSIKKSNYVGVIIGLFVSIMLIIGGLSGSYVLRGTNSSSALVAVGFLFLLIDIIKIYSIYSKSKSSENQSNSVNMDKNNNKSMNSIETKSSSIKSSSSDNVKINKVKNNDLKKKSDNLQTSSKISNKNNKNPIKESKKDNLQKTNNLVSCSKCGTLNPENSRFCNSCGHDLKSYPQTKCLNCGTINPENSMFCNSCGNSLGGQIFGISYHLLGYILKVIVFIMGVLCIAFSSEYEYVYTFEGCISSLIYLIFAYILLFYMGYVTLKKLSPKIHTVILDILALISFIVALVVFITEGLYLFNDLQIGFVIIGIPIILFALYFIGKELLKFKFDNNKKINSEIVNNDLSNNKKSDKIIHYFEKDNKGDRHDTINKANSYWLGQRPQMADKPQFTLFIFDNANDAESALLELPFIHKAEDTGNLICDKVFQFGYYKVNDNIYEAIICGFDLTLDEFNNVEKIFIKYNGKRKNSLEPSSSIKEENNSEGDSSSVRFSETYEYEGGTYECYEANSKADAIAFLNEKEVIEGFYYIHVKTPNGIIGKDINGTFEL